MNATFADSAPPTFFNPATIGGKPLADLRRLSLTIMESAPRFGSWLHGWIQTEELIRAGRKPRQLDAHALCVPDVSDWPPAGIGQALEAIACLAFSVDDDRLSLFVNRILMGLAVVAARRLGEIPDDE